MKPAKIPVNGNIAVYKKYCDVLSKNRLYTKLLIIRLFSIFTIKTLRAFAALAPYAFKSRRHWQMYSNYYEELMLLVFHFGSTFSTKT